jgi:hypothetical protein
MSTALIFVGTCTLPSLVVEVNKRAGRGVIGSIDADRALVINLVGCGMCCLTICVNGLRMGLQDIQSDLYIHDQEDIRRRLRLNC